MYYLLFVIFSFAFINNIWGNDTSIGTECMINGIWIQDTKINFSNNIREYKIVLDKYMHQLEIYIHIPYVSKKLDASKLLSDRKLNNNEFVDEIHFDNLGKSDEFILDLSQELDFKSCNIRLFMNKINMNPTFFNLWLLDINNVPSINLKIHLENDNGKILNEYYIHIFNDKFKDIVEIDNVSVFDIKNLPLKIDPPFSPNTYHYKALINPLINDQIKLSAKCKYDVFINNIKQHALAIDMPNHEFQKVIKVTCVNSKNSENGVSQPYYFHFIKSTDDEIKSPKFIIPLATGLPCLLTKNDDLSIYICYGCVDSTSFMIQTNPDYLYAIKFKNKRHIFNKATLKLSNINDIQLEIFNGREKKRHKILFYNDDKYIPFKYLSFHNKILVLLFLLTFIFSSLIPSLLQIILSRNYIGINYFSYIFNIIITYIALGCFINNKNINHNISSVIYNIYACFLKINSNNPWSFSSCANLIWSYTYYKSSFIIIRFICSHTNILKDGMYIQNYTFMDYNTVSVGNLDWPLKTFISVPLFGACFTILNNAIKSEIIFGDDLLINEAFDNGNDILRLKVPSTANLIKWVIFETNIPLICTTLIVLIDLIYNTCQYFNKCYKFVKNEYLIWRWNDDSGDDYLCNNGYWSDRFCNQLYTEYTSKSTFFNYMYQDFCGLTQVFDFEKWKSMNRNLEHQNNKMPWNNYEDKEKIDLNSLSSHYCDLNNTISVKSDYSGELSDNIPVCVSINKILRHPIIDRPFGIIKCEWMDILLNWKFVKEISHQNVDLSNFKLIIKSTQLHGPLSNGEFKPVFNATRVPYMFFELFMIRCTLGILFGIIINKRDHITQQLGLILILILFCIMVGRITVLWPFSRNKDNIILLICLSIEILILLSSQFHFLKLKHLSTIFSTMIGFIIQIGIIIAFINSLSYIYSFSQNTNRKLESFCNCILSVEFPETNIYCTCRGFSKIPIYSTQITFDHNLFDTYTQDNVYISPIITNLPIIAISNEDFDSFANNNDKPIRIPQIIVFFGNTYTYKLRRIIIYDVQNNTSRISDILKNIHEYSKVADEINLKILKYHERHVPTNSILSVIIKHSTNFERVDNIYSYQSDDESTASNGYSTN